MYRLIASLALACFALPAFAQLPACPAAPADPIPRDQARLAWVRPGAMTDGNVIAPTVVITYTVYERVGTTDTARCTTTNTSAGQTGLTDGAHTWVVTARIGSGLESAKSGSASKTIPPSTTTPAPPTNVTVASTRIDSDSWTCRDSSGAILSRHERQDKAQESCTNYALANLGTPYEMRPSGYRIQARAQ
jgi:hypothetical protein